MSVTVLPLLSWWLIGFVYVPFVELGSMEDEPDSKDQNQQPLSSRVRALHQQRERGEWIRQRLKDSSICPESIGVDTDPSSCTPTTQVSKPSALVPSSSASVRMYIPRCKFLVNARKLYGSSGGDRACKNE